MFGHDGALQIFKLFSFIKLTIYTCSKIRSYGSTDGNDVDFPPFLSAAAAPFAAAPFAAAPFAAPTTQ